MKLRLNCQFLAFFLIFLSKNSLSSLIENKPKIDPLAIHIALGQSQQQTQVIFSKNIKNLIKYLYRGYISNLMKSNINPHRIYDKIKKKFVDKKVKLRTIKCEKKHAVILGASKYLGMLYQEIYHTDQNNVRDKHVNILNAIMRLILETGNSCKNLLDYYYFFKKEMKLLTYLTKSKKSLNNTGLLLQITSSKNDFLTAWGDFKKMGQFLGHIFSWYRVFKPKTKLQQQAAQVANLLTLLKATKKDKKVKEEIGKKKKINK